MPWYYRYKNGRDYISQEQGPLGLHDLLLGNGDVSQLLRELRFSEQNIERLLMARFMKYQQLADYAKLKPGVKLRCSFQGGGLVDCSVVRKDDPMWLVKRDSDGDEFLIDLDEIKYIKIEKEEEVGCNRREGVKVSEGFKKAVLAGDTSPLEKAEVEIIPGPIPKIDEPTKKAITVDAVIASYIKTRDALEAEKKIYEEKVAKLKASQIKKEEWLTKQMDALGTTSMKKTGIGIAFFKTRTSATMADATQFVDWVKEDWDARNHFLEKRVSKTAVDEAVADGKTPPPGTNYSTTRVIQVNRG